MKLCLKCGSVGDRDKKYGIIPLDESNSNISCKNIHNDFIIEVDEDIAWDIFQLNKAGYKTRFSCSGHLYNKYLAFYIAFDKDYKDILNYFNKYNPKYLELEKNQYFYCKDDNEKILGMIDQDTISDKDNFIFIDNYAYIVRSKNFNDIAISLDKINKTSIDDLIL